MGVVVDRVAGGIRAVAGLFAKAQKRLAMADMREGASRFDRYFEALTTS